jgi:hypothetical protein
MLNTVVDYFSVAFQSIEGPLFIRSHEAAVTDHIGG